MPSEFRRYYRKLYGELRPYVPGEKLPENLTISDHDLSNGSPKEGDMISRDPHHHEDQWLVSKAFFEERYCTEPVEVK